MTDRTIEQLMEVGGKAQPLLTVRELHAEIARLRERLEIDPEHEYDGIYTRDETIRLLVENSQGQHQTAMALVKKARQRDDVIEVMRDAILLYLCTDDGFERRPLREALARAEELKD